MAKNKNEKAYRVKKKRNKIGFWTRIFVLVIVGYFAVSFYQQSVERRELEAEMQSLQQEKAEIEARIEDLEKTLRTGDTDEAIEKLARENLTMIKEGEKVYILDTTNTLNQELTDEEDSEDEDDEKDEDDHGDQVEDEKEKDETEEEGP